MKRAHARKKQNDDRQQRNRDDGNDPAGQLSPVELVGHSANINTSYSERLSYGPYMNGEKPREC